VAVVVVMVDVIMVMVMAVVQYDMWMQRTAFDFSSREAGEPLVFMSEYAANSGQGDSGTLICKPLTHSQRPCMLRFSSLSLAAQTSGSMALPANFAQYATAISHSRFCVI
jgi:hypothetical protein